MSSYERSFQRRKNRERNGKTRSPRGADKQSAVLQEQRGTFLSNPIAALMKIAYAMRGRSSGRGS